MNPEFDFHLLNDLGKGKAIKIANIFNNLLNELHSICPENSRHMAITKTKLEEACFFAKKAMASDPENHTAKNEI